MTAFESLFENSSRGMVLCSIGEGHPLQQSAQPREGHTWMRKEGETRLASQISQINAGDQWGNRLCSQISLYPNSSL